MSNRSRLSRHAQRKTQKNLFLSLLGIVVVLFVLFKFGIPLLINITLFMSGSKPSQNLNKNDAVFIAPPILNPIPSATNSAEIVVSGTGDPKQTILLFLNESLSDKVQTKDDGTFSISETLNPGENTIKAKVQKDPSTGSEQVNQSDFSQTFTVVFKNAAPSLTVDSPTDGQTFSKDQNTVDVKGSTDPDVKVTVNDFWAIADGSSKFSYTIILKPGENPIKIQAVDQAGNKTEKNIKVIYNP